MVPNSSLKTNMTKTIHKNPLVSIIIISYNSAKYISDTLESAYNQTWQNIELIVADDGSEDKTTGICQKWIEQNNKRFVDVKLITSPSNTGIPANCNRGLYASKGEWIKLIAGDDILINDCIENNLKFIHGTKEPISFLFSRFKILKGNTILQDHPRISFFKKSESYFNKTAQKQFLSLLNILFVPAPTGFIKRSSLLQLDGFDEDFPLSEDFPMWLKATSKGFKLYFNPIFTTIYRLSETSLTDNYNKDYVYLNIAVINKYFSLIKRWQYPFHYLNYKITYYNKKRHIKGKTTFSYLTLIINPVAIIRIIKKRYGQVRKTFLKI